MIGGRLARGVRRGRIIGRLFGEQAVVAERAIDLIGRDMQEAEAVALPLSQPVEGRHGLITQQRLRDWGARLELHDGVTTLFQRLRAAVRVGRLNWIATCASRMTLPALSASKRWMSTPTVA